MTSSGTRNRRPQTEIRFPIEQRTDRHRKKYWLGWTDAPATLDLRDCAFFIFVGDNPEVCIRRRDDVKEERRGERREVVVNGRGELEGLSDDREGGCDDKELQSHQGEYDEDEIEPGDGYDRDES